MADEIPTATVAQHASSKLVGLSRWAVGLAATSLLVALLAARSIEPDERGFGTHQQLGLPPCTFLTLFGKRCPSCGMTTSWAYLTRGNVGAAAASNAGGVVLGAVAMLLAPWMLVSSVVGRWLVWTPQPQALYLLAAAVAMTAAIDWMARIWLV